MHSWSVNCGETDFSQLAKLEGVGTPGQIDKANRKGRLGTPGQVDKANREGFEKQRSKQNDDNKKAECL